MDRVARLQDEEAAKNEVLQQKLNRNQSSATSSRKRSSVPMSSAMSF